MTAKVLVLYTGGTIGMAPRDPENPASPLEPKDEMELKRWLPANIENLGIEWKLERLKDEAGVALEPLDSSDVNSKHWKYMAKAIGDAYHQYDGFVILHGTDTMAYTTSALSFMFVNLAKPVVVTGSQLPISNPRTDAIINLVTSLQIAGWRASELPRIPEVVLCFADVILRGNRARKLSSSSWRGFESPNEDPLGRIGEHITIDTDLVRPVPDTEQQPFFVQPELNDNVIMLELFPGLRSDLLEAVFGLDGLKGVVLRTFGAGNGPSTSEFLDPIQRAVDERDLIVVNVTQCAEGKVEAGLYEASSGLLERGVLSGIDMTPEAALAKLMSLLENAPPAEIRTQMQVDRVGEMSESMFDLRYGSPVEVDGRTVLRAASKDGPVFESAAPVGTYSSANLIRAVLRASSVTAKGSAEVRVFVNHPTASSKTDVNDPRFACTLSASGAPAASDITAAIRRAGGQGPIGLTLVSPKPGPVEVQGLSLALFTVAKRA
jgi:L-asparaginase